ncbi:MAG: hypothetical protein RBQ94_02500 [Methanimicrococcus sp.]|nr:hypothetical protein [Methanimicrococcus sp.]
MTTTETNTRISELINDIQMIIQERKDLETAENALREELLFLFRENDIEKITDHGATVRYVPEKTSRRFESKKFKEEHPDLFEEYSSETITAAHLNIKVE